MKHNCFIFVGTNSILQAPWVIYSNPDLFGTYCVFCSNFPITRTDSYGIIQVSEQNLKLFFYYDPNFT